MNPISTFEPTIGAHVHGRERSAAAGSAHQFVAAAGASLPFMWLAAAVALATLAGRERSNLSIRLGLRSRG